MTEGDDVQKTTETVARFDAGHHVGVVGPSTLVLVAADPASDAVGRLREGVYRSADVDELLDVATDLGLRDLPSLVIVHREHAGLRVVVRGSFSARVTLPGGEVTVIEATTVRTWSERVVPDFVDVSLLAESDELTGQFEVARGTVPASSLGWVSRHDRRVESASPGSVARADVPPVDPSATIVLADVGEMQESAPMVDGASASAPAAAGAVADHPDDYDHLFGATRHVTVEQAAVRPVEEPEPDAVPVAPSITATPPLAPARATSEPTVWASPAKAHDLHPLVTPSPPLQPGMIDAVPGIAAGLTPIAPVGGLAAPTTAEGDHDGLTISAAELARLRGGLVAGSTVAGGTVAGPTVQAVHCPSGHPNPPTGARCRICHQPVAPADPSTIPRPSLGVLKLSTGSVVALDRPLLIGRAPKLTGSPGTEVPHLVTVPSPDQAVSRNHAEVRLDGWHVLVVDLNSVNGTTVTLVGQAPQRLTPGSPFMVGLGAMIDFGGGVTCSFESA